MDQRRRNILEAAGVALIPGAITLGREAYLDQRPVYNGVPSNYVNDSSFHSYLKDNYPDYTGQELDEETLLVNVRRVEGEELGDRIYRGVTETFEDIGVDALLLEHGEPFPRDEYLDRYGYSIEGASGKIRSETGDSFWHEEVDGRMKDSAVTAVVAPGIHEGDGKGLLHSSTTGHAGGAGAGHRLVMADLSNYREKHGEHLYYEVRQVLLEHELGHCLGLEHSSDMMQDSMPGEGLLGSPDHFHREFNEEQAKKIRAALSA